MMFTDNKQIHIFCDIGRKRVVLVDSHFDKCLFARTKNHDRIYHEYLALSFALRYIKNTYKYRDILLITDAKSQSDVLNGNSSHGKRHPYKPYSDNLKVILDDIRYTNIVNLLWVPRRYNTAGIIEQKFRIERLTLFAQTNFEEVCFESIKPLGEMLQTNNNRNVVR